MTGVSALNGTTDSNYTLTTGNDLEEYGGGPRKTYTIVAVVLVALVAVAVLVMIVAVAICTKRLCRYVLMVHDCRHVICKHES